MRLETAAVLFRHHADDFTLWTVDLPASLLQEAKHMENTAFSDLDFVMEELPVRRRCSASSTRSLRSSRQSWRRPPLKNRPHRCWAPGDIYNLMSIAAHTLLHAGLAGEAEQMWNSIVQCGSYFKALGIIGEYVEFGEAPRLLQEQMLENAGLEFGGMEMK